MGLIKNIFRGGIGAAGDAVVDVAEVFRPNATRQMELGHRAFVASLDQHGKEFEYIRSGWFDAVINGLNRLPRPMLALGTLGLFIFAMVDPENFSIRMNGLALVPEPLWWLLGAIVSFYFGARELHYRRVKPSGRIAQRPSTIENTPPQNNPALNAWKKGIVPDGGRITP